MTQTYIYSNGSTCFEKHLPGPDEQLMSGVKWGSIGHVFSPANWLCIYWEDLIEGKKEQIYLSHGTLAEEIVFCLLGGFGIKFELADAAFQTCLSSGLISEFCSCPGRWEKLLSIPLLVNGKMHRYRYPKQKSRFIAAAMEFLQKFEVEHLEPRSMRNKLLEITGIGPKTASWIVRNFSDSDEVAILDIHLIRAGLLCGLFNFQQKVEKHYFEMESLFIDFCKHLAVRPARMDFLIWQSMRVLGDLVNIKVAELAEQQNPKVIKIYER